VLSGLKRDTLESELVAVQPGHRIPGQQMREQHRAVTVLEHYATAAGGVRARVRSIAAASIGHLVQRRHRP